jgi:hypothetical protein
MADADHSDFYGILRKLDEIDWLSEKILDVVEEIVAEAYEALVKGRTLPADWALWAVTRLQAIQAEEDISNN